MAHKTGVPPQFIKGHAEKESFPRFNRLSYRYEPIGEPYVGDLDAVSNRPLNLRDVEPFKFYRLATQPDQTNSALAKGTLTSADDRDVRRGYLIGCDANGLGGTPIGDGERAVNPTAWEIVRCSDVALKRRWAILAGAHASNRLERLENNKFTAQTGLAASYGFLQVTFRRSIDENLWPQGASVGPSRLLDTNENHAAGGGSLQVGTGVVARMFLGLWRNSVPPSQADLTRRFQRAWNGYNSGEGTQYGIDIPISSTSYQLHCRLFSHSRVELP